MYYNNLLTTVPQHLNYRSNVYKPSTLYILCWNIRINMVKYTLNNMIFLISGGING